MTYRTVKVAELYPTTSTYASYDLYVYSIENNTDGEADAGTYATFIGRAESYTQAEDLFAAACATARALGHDNEIGLCIKEDFAAYLHRKANQLLAASRMEGPYATDWSANKNLVLFDAVGIIREAAKELEKCSRSST